MLPRLIIAALPLLACAIANAESREPVELKLRPASDHFYAGLVLGARQLGNRFREEDVISGAERHFHEQLAQYCDLLTPEVAAAEGCRSSAPLP